MTNEPSERDDRASSGQTWWRDPRLGKVLLVAAAIGAFAYRLGSHIYRDGGSASMIFFIVATAVVLFLFIAPKLFGLGDDQPVDLTVGSIDAPKEGQDENPSEPSRQAFSKWRR